MRALKLTRRRLLMGGMAAVVLAGAGALSVAPHWLRHHGWLKPHGPYADLLAGFEDSESAAEFGKAVTARMPGFQAKSVARALRARGVPKNLDGVLQAEITAGKLQEVGGWLVPETLALLVALAASGS